MTLSYEMNQRLPLPYLLSHAQPSEEAVKQTTRAVAKQAGHSAQKGTIIATKEAVNEIPINANKKDIKRQLLF